MTPESPLTGYRRLVESVDSLCREVFRRYGPVLACSRGCDGCCRHLSLFPVEAVALRLALDTLDRPARSGILSRAAGARGDACPLLSRGLCLMYDHRPIICRTHGMPILVRTEAGEKVDFCPMNFAGISRLDREAVIDLERLNTALALVNRIFVERELDGADLPERIPLAEALLMDLETGE
jgi:Fe-S-cluster containining protein